MKRRGGPSPCWLRCAHTCKGHRMQPRSSSPCRKEDSSCQVLEETRAILHQPSPMALFENSPASLQSYQEASVEPEPHLLLCKGPGTRSSQPEKGWALLGRSQAHIWVLCSHKRQHNCSGPAQLSPEWSLDLQHCCGTVPELSLSAQAMHQTLCNQKTTGLDFTHPNMKQLCEMVLLFLQPGYPAHYPRDACKAFPLLWAALVEWKSQGAQENICPQCYPILRHRDHSVKIKVELKQWLS